MLLLACLLWFFLFRSDDDDGDDDADALGTSRPKYPLVHESIRMRRDGGILLDVVEEALSRVNG